MKQTDALQLFREEGVEGDQVLEGKKIPEFSLYPGQAFQWVHSCSNGRVFLYAITNLDQTVRKRYQHTGWEACVVAQEYFPGATVEQNQQNIRQASEMPQNGFFGGRAKREIVSAGVKIKLTSKPNASVLTVAISLVEENGSEPPIVDEKRADTNLGVQYILFDRTKKK